MKKKPRPILLRLYEDVTYYNKCDHIYIYIKQSKLKQGKGLNPRTETNLAWVMGGLKSPYLNESSPLREGERGGGRRGGEERVGA